MRIKKWLFICTILLFVLCDTNVQAKPVKQKAYKPTSPLAEFVANDKIGDVYSKEFHNDLYQFHQQNPT